MIEFKLNKVFMNVFSDVVRGDIKDMKVGETVKADLSGRTVANYRMTLVYVTQGTGAKFKTKVDKNTGDLYLLRVA